MKCIPSRIRMEGRLREGYECGDVCPREKARSRDALLFAHGFPEMARSGRRILDRGADCVYLRSLRWASITSSSRAPTGPSATRTKVPCCHPGLVVSSSTARCSWVAAVVVLLFLILCCPILALASSHPLTYHQTQTHPSPYHSPYTTSPSRYTTLPGSASTGHRLVLPRLPPQSLHVPPAWDCACKPLDPSKSHASNRRHRIRDPATTQYNHNQDHIISRQPTQGCP